MTNQPALNCFALSDCYNITSVTFGENSQLTSIGEGAFNGCESLESITIPDGVKSIGNYAFEECALESITIPGSVLSIGDNAFKECTALESAIIADGVTSIGDNAFYNCTSLVNVSLPDSLTSIGSDTFYGCANLQLYDDGTAYYLGNSENHYLILVSVISKEITSFTIDDKTKFIWNSAFSECRVLENIENTQNILCIGSYAF